jgi:manganese-dependent inorganic pyrophosphatase
MAENNEIKDYGIVDGMHVSRKRTTVEKEYSKRKMAAHGYVSHLDTELPEVDFYVPQALGGAIFCGHLVTDLDSIAGSIGAAELYGGIPARASEVNSETAFALQRWGVEKPRPIEELLVELPKAGVCLVDHQQTSQLNKSIDVRIYTLCECKCLTTTYFFSRLIALLE